MYMRVKEIMHCISNSREKNEFNKNIPPNKQLILHTKQISKYIVFIAIYNPLIHTRTHLSFKQGAIYIL